MLFSAFRAPLRTLGTLAVVVGLAAGSAVAIAPAAQAAATDGATSKGRATGSGKWGYVGQFGQLNKTTAATAGQFFLPYSVDVNGKTVAVTDSGLASWETGSKTIGHTLQTFNLNAEPGSAGHGDYLGNGQYDVRTDKSALADPANIVEPLALKYDEAGTQRGPRGVVIKDDGSIVESHYEGTTAGGDPRQTFAFPNANLGTPSTIWGPNTFGVTGATGGPVHVDKDSAGNIYTAVNTGVNINAADGTFLSSMGGYFDADGVNQTARMTWANRKDDVKTTSVDPKNIGEVYGLSVVDQGDSLAVYVGEAGGYYQPDPSIHFQDSTTAKYLNQGSITKFLVEKSGGKVDSRWNPAGWKWTLDTSFGTGGTYIPGGDNLISFANRYFFVGQTVFDLEADPKNGNLYYALNGSAGPVMGTLDLSAGTPKSGPAAVNAPSAQQDSSMSYVRGLSTDDRGLVYAATQQSTTTSTARAIVQIWGMTPSSIAGTATATPSSNSAALAWGDSAVGHAQSDLLDYVVQYRKVGDTAWTIATPQARAATSTTTTRTIAGLTPATAYEARITPWNEAGSGDPALVTFQTDEEKPELTVTKTGNTQVAATPDDAVKVAAGADVAFEYTVENTGNVPLTGVTVSDDKIATLTPPAGFDGTLAPKAKAVFTATGPVAAGSYTNTVTATSTEGASDTDVWNGFGQSFELSLVKMGNGAVAATAANALRVPADSTVDFSYEVTNSGNSPLSGVSVSDDKIAGLTPPDGFDGTLDPRETAIFTASGPVAAGAYTNTATAKATEAKDATADWHGFGETKGLTIVKKGNGKVATAASDAVKVPAGSDVKFSYEVTNAGNVVAFGVTATDDQLGDLTAPAGFEGKLEPGETVVFTATGPVAAGAYKNTANTSAQNGAEASTQWHGFGETTGLSLVKKGNDTLAPTAADAVSVPADSAVNFSYVVTNEGNTLATDVTVADDKISAVTAPDGFDGTLEPGKSATFTATGPIPAGAYKNTATAKAATGAEASAVWHGKGEPKVIPTDPTPTPTTTKPTPTKPVPTTPEPTASATVPTAEPTPAPSSSEPTPSSSAAVPPAPATTPTSSTPLPETGTNGPVLVLGLLALGLAATGIVFLAIRRRGQHG